jgi:hypothetical protein
MAPGTALAIPRLSARCLDPFRPRATFAGAFALAQNLLLAGIGAPDDWESSNGDPVNFMLHKIEPHLFLLDSPRLHLRDGR